MGGGLLQLAAIGEQDLFLSGNPQITFFKTVHRRHTNFSIEAIEQIITGNILNDGCSIYSNISDNGDLVSNMWLDVLLPTIPNQNDGNYYVWCNNTGHALIDEIDAHEEIKAYCPDLCWHDALFDSVASLVLLKELLKRVRENTIYQEIMQF